MAVLTKIIHNKKFQKFLLENDIAWLDIKDTSLLPFAISLFKTKNHLYTKFPLTNVSLLETFIQSNSHHQIKLKSTILDIDETLRFLKLIEAFPSEFDIPPVVGNYHVLCERFRTFTQVHTQLIPSEIESKLNEHLLELNNEELKNQKRIDLLHKYYDENTLPAPLYMTTQVSIRNIKDNL